MSCLFCKIVAGELDSRQVYADDQAIAFLDIEPWHRGHTLVIPREHASDFTDPAGDLAAIAPAIQHTARLLKDTLGADGINMLSSAGAAAGQEVFHLHVHLVPRYATDEGSGVSGLTRRDPHAGEDLDAVLAQLTGRE